MTSWQPSSAIKVTSDQERDPNNIVAKPQGSSVATETGKPRLLQPSTAVFGKREPLPSEAVYLNDPSAANQTQVIVDQQNAGRFPQGARGDIEWTKPNTYWDRITLAATGSDRRTAATENIPSLVDMTVSGLLGDTVSGPVSGALTSASLLTAFNPVEQVKMLSEASDGKLNVRADEAGNIILNVQGREAMLNNPGLGPMDFMQLGATAALYSPSGVAAQAGLGITKNAVRVGAASLATQVPIEAFQAAMGGQADEGDVVAATLGGGTGQAVFQRIAQAVPFMAETIKKSGFTDKVKEAFRRNAPEWMNDEQFESLMNQYIRNNVMPEGTDPEAMVANAAENTTGIRLTEAQRTGNQAGLREDDLNLQGINGPKAEKIMRDFQTQQRTDIDTAVDELYTQIAPNVPPGNAPGLIQQQLKENYAIDNANVSALYENAGPAELSKNPMREIMQAVTAIARVDGVAEWRKETSQALKYFQNEIDQLDEIPDGPDPVINFKKLENNFRKRLLGAKTEAQNNPEDARQVGLLIGAYDNALSDIVFRELFTGDAKALAATEAGRRAHSIMMDKYFKQPQAGQSGAMIDSDPGGLLIEKMINLELTDRQIANGIFGANGISSLNGKSIVNKLRGALGEESEAWLGVRVAAANRFLITRDINGVQVFSPKQSMAAFNKAMKDSPELMNTLYTGDELVQIKTLLDQIKRTDPDIEPSKINPSNSGMTILRNIGRQLTRLLALSGAVDGSIPTVAGAVVGDAAMNQAGGFSARSATRAPQQNPLPLSPMLPGSANAVIQSTQSSGRGTEESN